MKKFEKGLISISKSLSKLAETMEKLAESIENDPIQVKPAMKKAAKKKATPKKKAAAKKKVAAKKAAPESTKSTVESNTGSLFNNIYELVGSSKDGITVAEIKEKTGLAPRQVSNALYKLTKKGQIETIRRGVYVTKKA